jgi:endonuclease/exonuclease/phosphatase family metal-dependent hydrolase
VLTGSFKGLRGLTTSAVGGSFVAAALRAGPKGATRLPAHRAVPLAASAWFGRLPLWAISALAMGCVEVNVPGADDPSWTSWDDAPAAQRVEVRVATWNIEFLGEPDSIEYDAVRQVLRRLDADVVLINEVDASEATQFAALAAEVGYPVVETPGDHPFGDTGNAVLSRLPLVSVSFPTAASLSGDSGANDLTRLPVLLTSTVPGTDLELTVVGQHWKSGFELTDLFRRNVDAVRPAQAVARGASSDLIVAGGDVNEELISVPGAFGPFVEVPEGMPGGYDVGADVLATLSSGGLPDNPFQPLLDQGLTIVDALQRDGRATTRPTSGRRLDHLFVSESVASASLRSEVYDSADEALDGLADGGSKLDYNISNQAADHLPVLIVFRVTAAQ